MCLLVKDLPYSSREGLVVPCFKSMRYCHTYRKFFTPFWDIRVPDNGWLLPSVVLKSKTFYKNDNLGKGFIHGYVEYNPWRLYRNYEAFAIQVAAYGDADLACRAMYIVPADVHGPREKTVSTLKSVKTKPALISAFPFLKDYLV